ncbi:hypothetical protein MPTK1_1g21760 [Marchantia polymorpha subsp. ruderalis]|uniref:Uncharacterized protein n=2 Tax=Marchantia polymorpha TaxID=3197 RepID=A0AAF6AST8_MARPO|nr:hypothetical protein MARPO_0001s0511 [Marchantia polymorpha]PTQ50590.1 hypothetical protein MARPO_0001s0511 [Marchantia polymorpha]BBM99507.1 hypothetical protein Mp_1g21760 [Marchantia polymorpha subsp. ruderalis]BBM99508.1 hypothetical protein Mp_1g21760 [Marchantia polymorpha subsp. ruderalis]|eukprot:PTQ50589.1 hypothetical protein MARPO_0001s0511 [Marchantia polymorpha]
MGLGSPGPLRNLTSLQLAEYVDVLVNLIFWSDHGMSKRHFLTLLFCFEGQKSSVSIRDFPQFGSRGCEALTRIRRASLRMCNDPRNLVQRPFLRWNVKMDDCHGQSMIGCRYQLVSRLSCCLFRLRSNSTFWFYCKPVQVML